jgi:hypothetical protein
MKRSSIQRAVAGGILMASLALAAPITAQAAAWSSGSAAGAVYGGWGWLGSIWEQLVALAGLGGTRAHRGAPAIAKNGAASGATTNSGGSGGVSAQDDSRPTINPDGGN